MIKRWYKKLKLDKNVSKALICKQGSQSPGELGTLPLRNQLSSSSVVPQTKERQRLLERPVVKKDKEANNSGAFAMSEEGQKTSQQERIKALQIHSIPIASVSAQRAWDGGADHSTYIDPRMITKCVDAAWPAGSLLVDGHYIPASL
ncbi:predicted protein [Histoplasma capsulatum var. duboisii H88]|uniref:Predicted protein n=2 Tax=Ajellomyces capsulatus TaxID=5037 RepID=F0U876_AJEC8|nr:predicted protein [Histoplasma capsulatum H143]EGC41689.1 predicted protein [Histoplasma capsulatum var. duboisii H88]